MKSAVTAAKLLAKRAKKLQARGFSDSAINEQFWKLAGKYPPDEFPKFKEAFQAELKQNPGILKPKLGKWIPVRAVKFLKGKTLLKK